MLKKSRSKKNLFLTLEAPPVPGVYSFFNSDEKIIYVGQSKNLRRRLGQYKNAKRVKRHSKMRKILSEASRLEYEVCASPLEAEILETQLIQRLRPKWNVMGAFYFLYPMIGMRISNGQLFLCYTTQPEAFPDFEFHGAYRSRFVTREGFFSLRYLLNYVGHPAKSPKFHLKYSYVFGFRQIPEEWFPLWTAFWRGESDEALPQLALTLLENAGARSNSSEVQEKLRDLRRFWRNEARPLFRARESTRYSNYPVSQQDRDILFLKYRAGFTPRKNPPLVLNPPK